MGTKIVIQPLLPKISVEKVDWDNIESILALLKSNSELFTVFAKQLDNREARSRLFIDDDKIVLPSAGSYLGTHKVIATVGDFYAVSENGYRHFTHQTAIRHGVLNTLPREMFIPLTGDVLDEVSFMAL